MKVTKAYSSIEDVAPEVLATPLPKPVHPNCEVVSLPDESVIITLQMDAVTMNRHRRRAGTMDLSRYLWENVLHRALVDSVY